MSKFIVIILCKTEDIQLLTCFMPNLLESETFDIDEIFFDKLEIVPIVHLFLFFITISFIYRVAQNSTSSPNEGDDNIDRNYHGKIKK